MIGFAPPLPHFWNLSEYVSVAEYELDRELSSDEIIFAMEERNAGRGPREFANLIRETSREGDGFNKGESP